MSASNGEDPVDAQKKRDAEKQLGFVINEVYTTELTLHNNMREFVKDYHTMSTGLFEHMSLQERAELEYLMTPYINLVEIGSPLENTLGDNATLDERLTLLIKQFNSPKFKDQFELLVSSNTNLNSFNEVLLSIRNKESIKNDNKQYDIQYKDPGHRGGTEGEAKVVNSMTIYEAMIKKIIHQPIQPTQRGPRYQMLLTEVGKNLSKMEAPQQQIDDVNAVKTKISNDLAVMNKLPLLSQTDLATNSAAQFGAILAEKLGNFEASIVKMKADFGGNPSLDLKTEALSRDLEAASGPIDKFKVITTVFADAYLDERTKGLKGFHAGTLKGPFLTGLENSISSYLNLQPNKDETQEELIFKNASIIPDVRTALVKHLASRAMAEGVLIGNEQIFTNAVKAIVRMGNDAINEWNYLNSKPVFKLDNTVVDAATNTVTAIKENQIAVMFSKITPAVKQDLKAPYALEVMLAELKNTTNKNMKTDQLELLDNIISQLETAKSQPKEFHNIFLQAFTKVYIDERKEKEDGALLQHLNQAATQFTTLTDSKMLTGEATKKRDDSAIFSSIENIPNKKNDFVEIILARALNALNTGQNKNNESAAKTEFVNCMKVIVRIKAIAEWDNLVKKYVNDSKPLIISASKDMTSKSITGKQYSESSIKKFYDIALSKNIKFAIDPRMMMDKQDRQFATQAQTKSLLSNKFASSLNTPSQLGIYSHSGSEFSSVSDQSPSPKSPKSPRSP